MKTLKFRAWSESQKEWHYFTPENISTYKLTFEMHTLQGDEFYLFTGLLDKNGKEIYEGDIVCRTYDDVKFTIKWDTHNVAFVGNGKEKSVYMEGLRGYPNMGSPLADFSAKGCEVIGNIYENPELLKETQ